MGNSWMGSDFVGPAATTLAGPQARHLRQVNMLVKMGSRTKDKDMATLRLCVQHMNGSAKTRSSTETQMWFSCPYTDEWPITPTMSCNIRYGPISRLRTCTTRYLQDHARWWSNTLCATCVWWWGKQGVRGPAVENYLLYQSDVRPRSPMLQTRVKNMRTFRERSKR